jgi:hypothetical protein
MGLVKQNISISLLQGVDTKTDPKQLPQGKLAILENGTLQSPGRIQKRPGSTALPRSILGQPSGPGKYLDSGQALTSFENELVLANPTGLYSFSESEQQWVPKGPLYSIEVTQSAVNRDALDNLHQDGLQLASGLAIYSWADVAPNPTTGLPDPSAAGGNGVQYSIIDTITGQKVVEGAKVINGTFFGTSAYSKCATLAQWLMVFYVTWDGTKWAELRATCINTGNPLAPVDIIVAGDMDATNPWFDVCPTADGTRLMFAYNSSQDSTQDLRVGFITSGPGVPHANSTALVTAGVVNQCVSISPQTGTLASPQRFLVVYGGGTGLLYQCVGQTLAVVKAETSLVDTGALAINAGAIYTTNEAVVYFSAMPALSYNASTSYATITSVSGGTLGASTLLFRSVSLAGKPFVYGTQINPGAGSIPSFYVLLNYASGNGGIQNTYFLASVNPASTVGPALVAKLLALGAPGADSSHHLAEVSQVSPTTFQYPLLIQDNLVSSVSAAAQGDFPDPNNPNPPPGGTPPQPVLFSQTGVESVSLDFFDPAVSYARGTLAATLHLTGGYLSMYDGARVVEHGFHVWPEQLSVTLGNSHVAVLTLANAVNVVGAVINGTIEQVQSDISGTSVAARDANTAVLLAARINGDVLVNGLVTATAVSNTVVLDSVGVAGINVSVQAYTGPGGSGEASQATALVQLTGGATGSVAKIRVNNIPSGSTYVEWTYGSADTDITAAVGLAQTLMSVPAIAALLTATADGVTSNITFTAVAIGAAGNPSPPVNLGIVLNTAGFDVSLTAGSTLMGGGPVGAGAGISTTGQGTYSYVGLYEWVDALGNRHQSSPSIGVQVTSARVGTIEFATGYIVFNGTDGSSDYTLTIAGVEVENGTEMGSDSALAAQVASDINANVTLQSNPDTALTAVPNGTVVILTAQKAGTGGNAITLAVGGTATGISLSGATLTGGTSTPWTNTVAFPTLRLTQKTDVACVMYRTEDLGQEYFRLNDPGSINNINNPLADTITLVDDFGDASGVNPGITAGEQLYTLGGVVENVSAPAASAINVFDNRIWVLPSGNRLQPWFSKQVAPGIPVQFSDLFTYNIPPQGGDVVAMASMDLNQIFFKESSIYYISGTGPDSTGNNSQWGTATGGGAQLVTSDVGCVDPRSVVLMPLGLMFKSEKGIYLLTRGLGVQYIGSDVAAYNAETVISAQLVATQNQVRFLTDTNTMLVYDYFVMQWDTRPLWDLVDSTVDGTDYTFLLDNGTVLVEDPTVWTDNGQAYYLKIQPGWLSFAGVSGFARCYYFMILGDYKSPHTLQVSIAYDYDPNPSQVEEIDATDIEPGFWGSGPVWGSDPVWGTYFPSYQYRINLTRQKFTSIQVTIQDIAVRGQAPTEGYTLSNLTFVVGVKQGLRKVPATHVFGSGGQQY